MEQALKPEEQAKIDAREVSKKHRASIDAKVRAVLSTGEAQGNVAVEPVANEALERLKKLLRRMDYRSGEVRHEAGEAIYAMFVALASSEPELRAEIVRLTRERDEALSRVEELEGEAETVSAEFEGDCWKALRSLLSECNFDWRDVEPDGVTADDAREHISTTLDELEKGETRNRERAEAAESRVEALSAEVGKLTEALEPFAKQADEFNDDWPDSMRPVCGVPDEDPEDDDNATFTLGDLRRARAFRDAIRSRAALDKGAARP